MVSIDGIKCSASAEAWQGLPRNLPGDVVPVKVRIRNRSGKPVRLLYQQFALVGDSGRKYRPLPLVMIPESGSRVTTLHPVYAAQGFFVAPKLSKVYPTLKAWPETLGRNDDMYQRSFSRWPDELPSRDMLQKGLPEGVLADGGTISGFLYFGGATSGEDDVTFKAEVPDASGDGATTHVAIPFRVE